MTLRKNMAFICISLLLAGLEVVSESPLPTRVVPINSGESVFSPFWDITLDEISRWKILSGGTEKRWCDTEFTMKKSEARNKKSFFAMELTTPTHCAGYDQMLACLTFPTEAALTIILDTNAGERKKKWIGKVNGKGEYLLPLGGAREIKNIRIEVEADERNPVKKGNFLWLGFRNQQEYDALLARRKRFSEQPIDRFLAPSGTQPSFRPKIGMLGDEKEIRDIQTRYQELKKKLGGDPLSENIAGYEPEKLMRETVPLANVSQFGREGDEKHPFKPTFSLIQKALIARNPELLRMAVRNCIVFALTPSWDSTFLADFPDTSWDMRSFTHTMIAESIALVLDYADDLLSPAGRALLQRRLAQEGLGQMNSTLWHYSYMFACNQFTIVNRGRIAAYLALEQAEGWNGPRIKPYTELAMREFGDSVNLMIQPDGGFLEGPPYFNYTVSYLYPVMTMYANARGIPLEKVIPQNLMKFSNFADVFISTDRRGGMIPFSSGQGDGRNPQLTPYHYLAASMPDSQWVTLYLRARKNYPVDFAPWDMSLWTLEKKIPKTSPPPKPFSNLPVMGAMASTRFHENAPVKFFLLGGIANYRGHRHNDRGSFVLEFDGDTYAADPGGQNYADADADNVRRSDYHNMLVPGDMPDNEPLAVSKANVYPVGKGDEKSFQAEILPAPSSYNYFTQWKRIIDSPSPNRITITDDYTLTPGRNSARFTWITELPWKKVDDTTIRLDGKNSYVLIRFPKDLTFSSETLTIRQKEKFSRLSFEKKAASGRIEIQVELFRKPYEESGIPARHDQVEYLVRRETGFRRGMAKYYPDSAPVMHHIKSAFLLDDAECMSELPDTIIREGTDGVVCESDLFASTLSQTALAAGYRLTETFSIVGFGNLVYSTANYPRLTTVSQDFEQMGMDTVRFVTDAIEKRNPAAIRNILLPVDIVERDSVKTISHNREMERKEK